MLRDGGNQSRLRGDLLGNLLDEYMGVRTPNCCCEFVINMDLPLWQCDSLLVIRGTQTKICVFLRSEVPAGIFHDLLQPSMLEEVTLTSIHGVAARVCNCKGNNLKVAV